MKEVFIKPPFVYRPYSKAELARLYIPNCSHRVTMRKFNDWLRHSPLLWNKLQAMNLTIRTADLTYEQVKVIVGYLGEP